MGRHNRAEKITSQKADPTSERAWTGSHSRAFAELPYQYAKAGRYEDYYAALTDFEFFDAKVRLAGIGSLVDDFVLVVGDDDSERHINAAWRETLATLRHALRLSERAVARNANDLAPQLLGRIPSSNDPDLQRLLLDVLAPRLRRGCVPRVPPWLGLAASCVR